MQFPVVAAYGHLLQVQLLDHTVTVEIYFARKCLLGYWTKMSPEVAEHSQGLHQLQASRQGDRWRPTSAAVVLRPS